MALVISMLQTRRLLVVVYLLLWIPLLILAARRSYEADVFGWWSYRVFSIVSLGAIGLVIAGIVVFRALKNDALLERFERFFVHLRRRKILLVPLAAAPAFTWLTVVWYVQRLGVPLTLSLAASLLDLALVVLVCEMLLAFGGREPHEQRLLLKKCLLAGTSLLFTLLMVEIVGNSLHLESYVDWETNPKNLNARCHTDDFDVHVVTNGQGLRERRMIDPRHPDAFRVVAIGDSFTFGWGVENEQAYPKVAESLIREQYGYQDVEIINMGKPGRSPVHYLKFIREYASQLNPDVIVVGFLVTDDCTQIWKDVVRDDVDTDEALERCRVASQVNPIQRVLLKSYVARLVYSKVLPRLHSVGEFHGTGKRGPIFGERNPLDPVLLTAEIERTGHPEELWQRFELLKRAGWVDKGLHWRVNPWLVKALIFHPTGPADSVLFSPETERRMRQQWELCAQLLVEMKTTANAFGAELIVMAIPEPHLVSPKWLNVLEGLECPVSDEMLTSSTVMEWLRDDCSKYDVLCFDALDECRSEVAAGEMLYFDTDAHMTARGNQLLGKMLASKLAELRSDATRNRAMRQQPQ